jgi:hypothetical protein
MNVIERIERGEITLQLIPNDGTWRHAWDENDCYKDLLRLAKHGRQMQWVPISERLPEDGQVVDVLVKDLGRGYKLFRQTDYKFYGSFPIWVTHWMELPPLPESEN